MIRHVVGIMFSKDCLRVLLAQTSARAGGERSLDGVVGMVKTGEIVTCFDVGRIEAIDEEDV